MMNNSFNLQYNAEAVCFDAVNPAASDASLNLILGEDASSMQPEDSAVITDEEAELLLPGYALAFEEYHLHRAEGASPDEALHLTMKQWRKLWAAAAYVPHRRC